MKKVLLCLTLLLIFCGLANAQAKKRPGHLKSPCETGHWALRQNTYYACGQDQKWKEMDSVTFLYEDHWSITTQFPAGIFLTCVNHMDQYIHFFEQNRKGLVSHLPKPIGTASLESMEYAKLGEHYYVCGDNEAHRTRMWPQPKK